jgi:enterochelin esterase family protein
MGFHEHAKEMVVGTDHSFHRNTGNFHRPHRRFSPRALHLFVILVDSSDMRRVLSSLALCLLLSISCYSQGKSFGEFLTKLRETKDSLKKANLISQFIAINPEPLTKDSTVHFYYVGAGDTVSVPGEFNNWDPSDGRMKRINGTNFFYRNEIIPANGRVEYKIWVDSAWTLDPRNPRKSMGGWGENSDVWMPHYKSDDITTDANIPHGRIDTLWFDSYSLKVSHPVLVYTPPSITSGETLPSVYVTDGADYINIGKMNIILDKLIAAKKIRPVIGIFVDPRTVLNNPTTNQRMKEYSADDDYLDFLEKEVAPSVESKYPVMPRASERLIMGASMGGLISTYAVLKRGNFIANCAAQSPSYWEADSAVVKLADTVYQSPVNIYIDTGNIHDTQIEARLVRNKLIARGFQVNFAEYPEGHNWTNWRARIPVILQNFFGLR